MTAAELEQALQALAQRLAAIEQRLADEDAEREAAAERQRRQEFRDDLAARRPRHPLDLTDVDQTARWEAEVTRAVNRFRRRTG